MHLYYDHTLHGHKYIYIEENNAEYDHSIGAYSKLPTRICTYTMIILCMFTKIYIEKTMQSMIIV